MELAQHRMLLSGGCPASFVARAMKAGGGRKGGCAVVQTTQPCSGELGSFHGPAIKFLWDGMSINHFKQPFLTCSLTWLCPNGCPKQRRKLLLQIK